MAIDKLELRRKKDLRVFRRVWIPVIKSVVLSLIDIVGDWTFYSAAAEDENAQDLSLRLAFFSSVSTVLGCCFAISLFMHHLPFCASIHSMRKQEFQRVVDGLLLSEMIIEDIPQLVLTAAIWRRSNDGMLSSAAVFNISMEKAI